MSHEIVPADPIHEEINHYYSPPNASPISSHGTESHNLTIPFTRSLTSGRQHVPEPFDSERLPSTLASDIQKFLRVANLLENGEPRVAYLCRFHAFEVAHNMDKNSTGRGVRQFKTSLLQRLEPDDETTLERRKEKSDARELRRVYHIYKDYFTRSSREFDLDDSHKEKLINARRIAVVLEEVLRAVESAADPQALADIDSIQTKSPFYVPYNILPLAHGSIPPAILQLSEVKAAIAAVRNTRGLPSAQDFQKSGAFMDLFEFLHYCFGFQEGNVANQREHLILLLANIHNRKSHKQSPISKMAYELHGILTGAVSMKTGENVMPAYGGGFECFLNNVVTPIYQEAEKNKSGTADHSTWRNYDDLNEYFWSPDCFQIGWPMRLDHDFFCVSPYYCKLKNAQGSPIVNEKSEGEEKEDEEQGPRLYVGCGMQETQVSQFKYTLFWILVLLSKFSFSYIFEIKPLIAPTRLIMKIGVQNYDWHELFPKVKSNAGAIVAVWAPIIIVYFMDTQIWYSVFCAIFGGLYGILHHLGEIRTLGMLRSRFHTLPSAFNICLIPPAPRNDQKKKRKRLFRRFRKEHECEKEVEAKFVLVWNQIVNTFRSEDLISNRELDLMTIPMSSKLSSGIFHWPIFLLANKFSTALSIARDFVGKDEVLLRKLRKDKYMYCAVKECYESLKDIIKILVVGDLEKRLIFNIENEIKQSIEGSSLLEDFKMSELLALQAKCIELVKLLVEGNKAHRSKVVKVLQDIFELVTNDMMTTGSRVLDTLNSSHQQDALDFSFEKIEPLLFAANDSIKFPLPDCPLNEQIKRFLLLLTVKDKAMDIPANLEARRRISFFATSLFMDMPNAPKVRDMLSFSIITPHYLEDINFSMNELHSSKEQVSIIFYMQQIYPDEWKNFLERMGCKNLDHLKAEDKEEELRNWASFRGQTLSRSVRGMMYYREALKLQAFLDMAEDKDILEGYEAAERNNRQFADALSDLKFTYVISCQMFGSQKSSGDPHAQDILDLMIRYPSLRVAYVEEKEEIVADKPRKVYSSILLKAVNGLDQEIYRIKLPGPQNIGEGKPENQNHAIIFTRGEALQTIDMNQDNYLEEALKMRNLLQEFLRNHGRRPPTILGLREHIFTGSVSSLAWFMSYQETSFVTIGQRLLANPLRVRFHYGHPDVFDRVFHITRGGISKASKTINLSEDVFAGFNSTLRRGSVTYHEYLQVGKGRDVGLNQISKFEAKVANGNSEQTLSRDIYRLGRRFDFFRMLSCYFTTIGFYFSSLISVIGIYVFLYGQLYLVLSGLQKALIVEAKMRNIQSLETALASQSFIQLGLLTGLPMVMEIGLEKGFLTALKDFILMQLQLASVFFTFSLGSKIHYYGRTILHGGAKYRPTGRKVVVFHASFTENYRLYSRSHFVKGFELLLLLIVYDLFRRSYQSSMAYVLITYSIWFMSITWLFAPFLFNPSGFSWDKIVDDWKDWNKWIKQQGGIGIQQDKSWESWWNDEQAHLRRSGLGARLLEILLSLRFFIYQYGLVYHLDISQQSKNFLVYVLSWVVILAVFLTVKAVNMGRQQFSANYHLVFRFFKAFLFLGILSTIISLSVVCQLSFKDIIVCCLAFLPTGWGLILIAQAVRPKIEDSGIWYFVQVLSKAYDYGMGIVLYAPIAILAWLPIISAFQTRFLFNEAFNRHLQIQPILAGKKKHK
ncbi:hypothetical protein LWI28_028899 [Acer negundo]|uniref:1,3-beta-glucan synthase n=1 Tax=Acer negundo TaxID=4023 RepID=A0AAD5JBZ6_ACENE|nr:hypothetical protein LWI28_028899 [Acer negundo]